MELQQRNKVYVLKCVSKQIAQNFGQCEKLNRERLALQSCDNLFIVKLKCTYQSRDEIYFLFEHIPGVDLWSVVYDTDSHSSRKVGRTPLGGLTNPFVAFYSACIILALEHLHTAMGIAYRDLKLENLLLDATGYVKLIDLGNAKRIPLTNNNELCNLSFTLCGTAEYLAPEMVLGKGHDKSVDFWALGTVMYELIVGHTPFYHEERLECYRRIINSDTELRFPPRMQSKASMMIRGFLNPNANFRLGNRQSGFDDIKKHDWFRSALTTKFDWDGLRLRSIRAPYRPSTLDPTDSHFSDSAIAAVAEDFPANFQGNQDQFEGF